jgi:serine phosphatase RsbU (regulator of sigma subunit)
VLGVFSEAAYVERSVMLVPGDRLVLYTDGVPEARSPSGEFYREARFETLLAANATGTARNLCEAALADVARFQGDEAHDDVTLLVISRSR